MHLQASGRNQKDEQDIQEVDEEETNILFTLEILSIL